MTGFELPIYHHKQSKEIQLYLSLSLLSWHSFSFRSWFILIPDIPELSGESHFSSASLSTSYSWCIFIGISLFQMTLVIIRFTSNHQEECESFPHPFLVSRDPSQRVLNNDVMVFIDEGDFVRWQRCTDCDEGSNIKG